jgi:hypothetical protein
LNSEMKIDKRSIIKIEKEEQWIWKKL